VSKTIVLTVEGLFGQHSYKGPVKLVVPSMKAATDLMRILERCTALEEDHFPDGHEGQYRANPVINLHPIGEMGVKTVNLSRSRISPSRRPPPPSGCLHRPPSFSSAMENNTHPPTQSPTP